MTPLVFNEWLILLKSKVFKRSSGGSVLKSWWTKGKGKLLNFSFKTFFFQNCLKSIITERFSSHHLENSEDQWLSLYSNGVFFLCNMIDLFKSLRLFFIWIELCLSIPRHKLGECERVNLNLFFWIWFSDN